PPKTEVPRAATPPAISRSATHPSMRRGVTPVAEPAPVEAVLAEAGARQDWAEPVRAEGAAARQGEMAGVEPAAQPVAPEDRAGAARAAGAGARRVKLAAAEDRALLTHRWTAVRAVARSRMRRSTAVQPAEATRNCAAAPASARPIPGTAAPGRAARRVHFPVRHPRAPPPVNARWGLATRASPTATRLRRTAAKRICRKPTLAALARRSAMRARRS